MAAPKNGSLIISFSCFIFVLMNDNDGRELVVVQEGYNAVVPKLGVYALCFRGERKN